MEKDSVWLSHSKHVSYVKGKLQTAKSDKALEVTEVQRGSDLIRWSHDLWDISCLQLSTNMLLLSWIHSITDIRNVPPHLSPSTIAPHSLTAQAHGRAQMFTPKLRFSSQDHGKAGRGAASPWSLHTAVPPNTANDHQEAEELCQ